MRKFLCWLGIHNSLLRWEYPNHKIYACYYCEKVTKELINIGINTMMEKNKERISKAVNKQLKILSNKKQLTKEDIELLQLAEKILECVQA